jgi:hypothetical protein
MMLMMWIEILSRHGDVASRTRIDAGEARIGRAFDNDIVVDDPHVAPHHLRVIRGDDGELVAEDLGTLNGLYSEHGPHRVTRLVLAKEPGLRIGRTILRIHDATQPVAPERLLTPPRAHARWCLLLGALLVLAIVVVQWLSNTGETSANLTALPILGVATALAVWASLWSIQSRLFFGQARFALHLRVAITAALAVIAWDELSETLSFALASRFVAEYGALVVWVIVAGTCYAHLRAVGTRHMKFAMSLVVALVAAGALLQYVGRTESQRLIGQRATRGDLRPPEFRLVPLANADDFFRDAEGTKRRVDLLRAKEPSGPVEGEPSE